MLYETLPNFLGELEEAEKAFATDVQNLIKRIHGRRWWEFWIPRAVPDWAKEYGN